MTPLKHTLAALAVSALFVCAPTMRADEWDKKTVISIDHAVQLPNVVLQPGTYVFKLLESQSDRHIVQVFNKEENQIITTILAIPNYRLEPKGKTVFSFWEVPAGHTPAVRAWFYPGDNFGQEFAYPKNSAMEVAAFTKTSVPTSNAQSAAEMQSSPVTSTNENGQSSALDQATYTAKAEPTPAPAVEPTPMPEPAPATAPQVAEAAPQAPPELPHTASQMPLIGLAGLLSLMACVGLKRSARVSR